MNSGPYQNETFVFNAKHHIMLCQLWADVLQAKLSQKPSALLIVSRPGARINLGAIEYMVIPLRF